MTISSIFHCESYKMFVFVAKLANQLISKPVNWVEDAVLNKFLF